ncbi:BPSS1780 family membrane protein [Undibacterium flavidum]|uniref:DUF2189 domain-containing protein n=1 Tax=Undibacterium flavidum TaxID=2762297 RepID=A0ABR6YG50_9BURK|nr:BPSS1780 family membrane protein [Undibacterium flavidum]MBC3875492.1 hypothetical protein [Undibacterium flavidum]
MSTPKAIAGWHWITHAAQLLKKRPFELLFSFMGLIFCLFGMVAIQYVGIVILMVLAPVLGMGFMQVCRQVDENQAFQPGALFIAFRTPALKALCISGFLQLLALMLSFAVTMAVDGGVLWDFVSNNRVIDERALRETSIVGSLLLARLFNLPAMMGFWFAAPLIMWNGMGVGKAIFYSFFAVWRARAVFATYLIAWAGILLSLPAMLALLATLLPGVLGVINLFLLPLVLVVFVVLYITFYTSYKEIFALDTKV